MTRGYKPIDRSPSEFWQFSHKPNGWSLFKIEKRQRELISYANAERLLRLN
jgi:hypothetical protein